MNKHPDGLNFVPLLGRSFSPPPSSRSRISLATKASQRSFVYYNGNYEGDVTMFKDRGSIMNLSLEETDSEAELTKDIEVYKEPRAGSNKSGRNSLENNEIWLLFVHSLKRALPQHVVFKCTHYLENFLESSFYLHLQAGLKCLALACLWIFHVLVIVWSKMGIMSKGLWKCRTFLRNASRRLLWWMTLAKCGDLTLFTLVLFCTPWLFVLAIIGFVVSLYCSIKEYLQRSGGYLRKRML